MMLSMVSRSRSVSDTTTSNTDPSSSSSNSNMSSGTAVAQAIVSLAHSGSSKLQESVHDTYNPSILQPRDDEGGDTCQSRHHQQISSTANDAAAVLTSVSRVEMLSATVTTLKKRSTKSKCTPGLRSGKWTPEEEAFTNMIIHYFKRGLLDVEDGTSLRWYLAKRLNCEAMRVTKKLKGNSSIGKQIFRSVENNTANRQAIRRAREDLSVVEARFLHSLNAGGVGPGTQHVTSAPLPSSLAVSVRGRKILPNMKITGGSSQPTLAPMPQPKSEDARLLMHFFSGAHDTNSDEEPEAEKKAELGSLNIDLSGKLGKKRPLSSVTNANAAKTPKTLEKQDSACLKVKRHTIKTDDIRE
ncbi:unnamed protein product [Peronospora belbahrii]|uniref:Uncharacterized protein n=1 Tax=Peronospora belbahrii TaxID=622444 RepID=A0AAU9L883_9STRA|nr:unnamed protein product [Peronospora belbahrii]CAH0522726.1 unnamed protein product [Peronospora belbahrii]